MNTTESIALTRFIGGPVVNADGEIVGKLEDLLMDDSGALNTAVVALGGMLGVGSRSVGIPFDDCRIERLEEGMQLRLPGLRNGEVLVAPEYHPVGGTAFERMKEQAANLTQAAVTRAGELGQSMSDTASDLAKRASDASSEIANRVSTTAPKEAPKALTALRDHDA